MDLPTDRYAVVDGLRLRYWLEGEAGPTLVLIHGIGGAVDVWRKQFERLPHTHRVLALDLPGCGRSAIPGDYPPDMLRVLASSVRSLMHQLGIDRGVVVGSSLGGAVAIEFAMRWPEMVASLVLIGPAGMSADVAWQLRVLSLRGVGEVLTTPDRMRTAHGLRQCIADQTTIDDDDIDRAYQMAILPGAQDAFLRLLRCYASVLGISRRELRRLQAGMRTIHAPVLLVWGVEDRILPVTGAATALGMLPNAALITRERSGHLVFVEEPAWFDELLTEYARTPQEVLAGLRTPPAVTTQPVREPHPNTRLRSLSPRTVAAASAGLLLLIALVRYRPMPLLPQRRSTSS